MHVSVKKKKSAMPTDLEESTGTLERRRTKRAGTHNASLAAFCLLIVRDKVDADCNSILATPGISIQRSQGKPDGV